MNTSYASYIATLVIGVAFFIIVLTAINLFVLGLALKLYTEMFKQIAQEKR